MGIVQDEAQRIGTEIAGVPNRVRSGQRMTKIIVRQVCSISIVFYCSQRFQPPFFIKKVVGAIAPCNNLGVARQVAQHIEPCNTAV